MNDYLNDYRNSAEYYDLILGKREFEKNAQFILKLLKKHKIKTVLELGCGTGIYLFPLKKAGFSIEGLDISKEMLREVKKRSKQIKLYQKNMATFSIPKKYDAILCLNSSLILLPTFKQIEKTLKKTYQHLKKQGILILDLPNHAKEIKEKNNSLNYESYKLPKGKVDVTFKDYKKGNKWVSEWHGFIKQGKKHSKFKEIYAELIYNPKTLEKTLKKQGFTLLQLYGSRRGGTFDQNKSYRRVYICQRN
jgi:ubiquinone/menaquinone biosynthesis C-methylase UbiE